MDGTITDSPVNTLMTDKEAAVYMRLTEKFSYISVQKWARQGILKGGRVGSHWRFRKEDLDDFMFARK